MPPTDINTSTLLRRWQSTGEVLLIDGATEYRVNNIEPGTMKFTPPMLAALARTDRSQQLTPMEGDMQSGSLSFTIKHVKLSGADELVNQMMERPNPVTGFKKEFTVELRVYDPGSTTAGYKAITTVYVAQAPAVSEGRDYDLIECAFVVRAWTPWATF